MKPRFPRSVHPFKPVCNEHSYRGDPPCPWPNCRNGIEEDEIVAYTPLIKGNETSLIRKEWSSTRRETRYRWDEQGQPCWLGLNKLIQEEITRTLGTRPEVGHVIYHYTNLHALFGIIESNCIWLTDYEYLNDSREINYGLSLAHEVLSKKKKVSEQQDLAALEAWETALRDSVSNRICVACFSRDSDSLSQWRAYGKSGNGICIGFDVHSPHFYLMQETSTGPVIYNRKEQEEILEITQHLYLLALQWDREKKLDREPKKDYYRPLFTSQVLRYISLFKDDAFSDEREIRIAYIEDPELFEKMGARKAKKLFRPTDRFLIPYTTSTEIIESAPYRATDDRGPVPIVEVIVGPQSDSDLTVRSLENYLGERGFTDTIIRKSKLPFRSTH